MSMLKKRGRSALRRAAVRLGIEPLETRAMLTTLPAGFSEAVVATGITSPTSMAVAPDGRIFVTQQTGQVRVVSNNALLSAPFLSLNVDSTDERGLLGLAFDPNFDSNHFVYVYYTVPGSTAHNRVSRFTANGDTVVAGSELVLLELNNLSASTNHNGGALHFGLDGKLYIGVGENGTGANAQTLTNLLGKMLRINSDGTIPTDNPFFNTASGVNRAIWALGLRNPFTFAVQPGSGRLFIDDVGQSTWEEIDDGIAGANYGWPTTEGETTNPQFTSPLFVYGHGNTNTTGCAIIGGAFYNPPVNQFPADYQGDYFFADLCNGWIRRYDPVSDQAFDFATGATTWPVGLDLDSDGSLLYLARGTGTTTGTIFRYQYLTNAIPLVAAPDRGSQPLVRVDNGPTNVERFHFLAYAANFTGGVRVATGDFNGDGIEDIVTAAGPGGGPHVRVFSGVDHSELRSFMAYPTGFGGGVYVATGDVDGDGTPDIITGAGAGGAPQVRVFSGATGTLIHDFAAFGTSFGGGVTVAADDVNGDGRADIIAGAGPGGGPDVRVYSGANGSQLQQFFAYAPGFRGGVFVAAARVDDDARAEIITGAGAGGGPHVRVFSGANGAELRSFFAYATSFTGGVRVGAGDFDADGHSEIITGPGPGGGPHVRVFRGTNNTEAVGFFAFASSFTGGVFVGGGRRATASAMLLAPASLASPGTAVRNDSVRLQDSAGDASSSASSVGDSDCGCGSLVSNQSSQGPSSTGTLVVDPTTVAFDRAVSIRDRIAIKRDRAATALDQAIAELLAEWHSAL